MYVIGGEAGIGKTRLVKETAALAALEGISVFTVGCQPHHVSRPLGVFIDIVPALRAAPGSIGVSPKSLQSLNALTSHTDDNPERLSDARDDVTRSELIMSAIRDLVDAIGTESPLLIIVEDAHWADHHSLRELSLLVQGASSLPLIVVCTTRTPETFPHSLSTDDRTVFRRLKPISKEAIATLATTLLPSQDQATLGLLEWSVTTSGGNPLFLQMLCRHYATTLQPFTIPTNVMSAVTRRVQQLSDSQRRILGMCTLLGKHASLAMLRSIVGTDRLQLLDVVQPLEEDGYLILEHASIRIAHDLLGQATLALLPPASRQLLHGCIAAALEQAYDNTADAGLLWDCAVQWEQSGDSHKAVEFLVRCARHAVGIGRASEAAQLLRRAEKSATHIADRSLVLRELILACHAGSEWTLTRDCARRLLELQPTLDHSAHEFAVLQALWNTELMANEAVMNLRRCIQASSASMAHRVDAAHLLICIAHESGKAALAHEAFGVIQGLLNMALETPTSRTINALYEAAFGDVNRGRVILEQMIEHSWNFRSVADELRAAFSACSIFVMTGATDRSIDLATKYLGKCEELGLHAWRDEFLTHVCMAYCIKEDYEAVEFWLGLIDSRASHLEGTCALRCLGCRIELCIAKSDIANAMQLLPTLGGLSLGDSLRGRAYFKSMEVRVRQIAPDYQVDEPTLQELRELFHQTKALSCADAVLIAYAEALLRRGRGEEVAVLLPEYMATTRREGGPLPPSLMLLMERSGCRPNLATLRTSGARDLAASTGPASAVQ
jgi:hypothetical protein